MTEIKRAAVNTWAGTYNPATLREDAITKACMILIFDWARRFTTVVTSFCDRRGDANPNSASGYLWTGDGLHHHHV
jgi:hypothetical protein